MGWLEVVVTVVVVDIVKDNTQSEVIEENRVSQEGSVR